MWKSNKQITNDICNRVLDLNNPSNYIVMGSAGTGKSMLLRTIIKYLLENFRQSDLILIVMSRPNEFTDFLTKMCGINRVKYQSMLYTDDALQMALEARKLERYVEGTEGNIVLSYEVDHFSSAITPYTFALELLTNVLHGLETKENSPLIVTMYDDIPLNLCAEQIDDLFSINEKHNSINIFNTQSLQFFGIANPSSRSRSILAQSQLISFSTPAQNDAKLAAELIGGVQKTDIHSLTVGSFLYKKNGKIIRDKLTIDRSLFP